MLNLCTSHCIGAPSISQIVIHTCIPGRLKETIIIRFTDSQEKQMQTLLLGIELSDKKIVTTAT